MKPDAPAEIRRPYEPIPTNVLGIRISEIFPRMAKLADKYALVRSVYHNAAAVHDTAHQMMQTGWLFQGGIEYEHWLRAREAEGSKNATCPRKTYDPFVLNADPSAPDLKVPDMLPPDYIAAVRVDRRRSWRSAIDQS